MSHSLNLISREGKGTKNKFITFFLNDEEYGILIYKVKEIIGMMGITPVPGTPKFIRGVINLRGKVIPVIDLRLKFGLDFKEYQTHTSIIINEITINDITTPIGSIVDSVSEVLQLKDEELEKPPSFGVRIKTDYFTGIAKVGEKVIIILDIDKVLTTDEVNIIHQLKEEVNFPKSSLE